MALIKCPNCGKQYSEHAEKCPKCGLTLQEAQEASDNRLSARKARNKVLKTILKVLGIALALAIAFFAVLKVREGIKDNARPVDVKQIGENEYAFVNRKGKPLKTIDCLYAEKKYDYLSFANGDVYDGLVLVKGVDGKVGFMDFAYNTVVPIEYDDSEFLNLQYDLISVFKNGKRGVVAYEKGKGSLRIPAEYDEIVYDSSSNMFKVKKDGRMGLIARDGTIIVSTESTTDGPLPKVYSWAYGGWVCHNYSDNRIGDVELYIGKGYLQLNRPFLQEYYDTYRKTKNRADFYPILCFPKLDYTVDFKSADEIVLYFEGYFGYDDYVSLNLKTKTISDGTENVFSKTEFKVPQSVLDEYKDKYENSPFWGQWQGKNRKNRALTLSPYKEPDIITRTGVLISLYDSTQYVELIDENTILNIFSDTEKSNEVELVRIGSSPAGN